MKVLIVAPYIYDKNYIEFSKNATGFGIMVKAIFDSVSETNMETYLLTNAISQGHKNILEHTWGSVLIRAGFIDWRRAIKSFLCYSQSAKMRLRYFYYELNNGSLRAAIQKYKPDIIHFHGIGVNMDSSFDLCREMGVPYIVTLHGLVENDDSAPEWDKEYERSFLIEAYREHIPITVISTGMKRRIEDNYLHHESDNITVICNGTRISNSLNGTQTSASNDSGINLREQYDLTSDDKIVVVIGSICERKNQIQIIKAFSTGIITSPCHVFFCGSDCTDGAVLKAIEQNDLSGKLHVLGFVPHDSISGILDQADLNVVASRDEGFGLSIIEAFAHGVPTVIFADLDAIDDLYDEKSMIKVGSRDDSDLALAIEQGLNTEWDKDHIRHHSTRFSLETMAKQYESEYLCILNRGGYLSIGKTLDYILVKKKQGYSILVYVGNISDNKNQIALVDAMQSMRDNRVVAVLAGAEADNGRVRENIIKNDLCSEVLLLGFCDEMDSVWKLADLNVFISKNDGFGLPVIEGYARGIPCVLNKELDAFEDLYNDKCCVATSLRDDDIMRATTDALDRSWDPGSIRDFGNRFSLESVAGQYVDLYKQVLNLQ